MDRLKEVEVLRLDGMDHPLPEFVTKITEALTEIPRKYRSGAVVTLSPHCEFGDSLAVLYFRPMTPEETAAETKRLEKIWRENLAHAEASVKQCRDELASLGGRCPHTIEMFTEDDRGCS